jgi:hypothetical protein
MRPDNLTDPMLARAALSLSERRIMACDWMHRRGIARVDGEHTGLALVRAMSDAAEARRQFNAKGRKP